MTAAATAPDAFKEVCLIGIIRESGSEIQFAALTEDITAFDWADKDIEGMPLVNGGRVAKWNPQGDESITMKVYPVTALQDGTGVVQWFHPPATADSTQPIAVDNVRTRASHRLILTWAYPTLPATAGASISNDGKTTSYRIQVVNAYMTSYKPNFDDKIFSAEITFKWTPYNKAGVANKREESCNGSAVLPVAGTSSTAL